MAVIVSSGRLAQYHNGELKETDIYLLTVLEAKSETWCSCMPSEDSRKECLLVSAGCQQPLAFFDLSMYVQYLPPSPHGLLPVFISVSLLLLEGHTVNRI